MALGLLKLQKNQRIQKELPKETQNRFFYWNNETLILTLRPNDLIIAMTMSLRSNLSTLRSDHEKQLLKGISDTVFWYLDSFGIEDLALRR
jgi:hypothetical protein